jgi:hypothetical protein
MALNGWISGDQRWKSEIPFVGGLGTVSSGKHTKNYGKSPFIVDLPIKNGHFQ